MKHIKHINELFSLRKLFNRDEETAEGILNSISGDIQIEETTDPESDGYSFIIDGFNITVLKVKKGYSFEIDDDGGKKYTSDYLLEIDGAITKCSHTIIKKILKKCYDIVNKNDVERDNYTRKDARIHFSKKR